MSIIATKPGHLHWKFRNYIKHITTGSAEMLKYQEFSNLTRYFQTECFHISSSKTWAGESEKWYYHLSLIVLCKPSNNWDILVNPVTDNKSVDVFKRTKSSIGKTSSKSLISPLCPRHLLIINNNKKFRMSNNWGEIIKNFTIDKRYIGQL